MRTMNRRLIGWALFVGPLVFWVGGMIVLAYADAGLKGLWMALILIVLMGSTMWGIYRIMAKGMSMIEDEWLERAKAKRALEDLS